MGRYDPVNIFFFSPTNLTTALNSGSTRPLESLRVTSRLNGVGDFECTYPYPKPLDGSYISFGAMEAVGNVVIFSYNDNRYPAGAGRTRSFGDCYRIESAVVEDRAQGGPVVRLRGRSLIAELEESLIWTPIGSQTSYATTIAADQPIPAPSSTTLAGSYAAGATSIGVTDGSAFLVGDMLLINLVGGGVAINAISGKQKDAEGNELPNSLELEWPLPGNVAVGATITRRARRVVLTSNDNAVEGSRIVITLNSGTHTTIIERGPEEEYDPDAEEDADPVISILVRDGITGAANAGNAISITDTTAPTTSDVSQAIANAPGWTSTVSGLGSGSSHMPEGASVYSVLESIAEINATPFKQDYDSTGNKPLRRIKWGIGNSGSGGKINLTNPPPADIVGQEASANRGIISGTISREWKWNIVTRIYPTGGDPGVSLYGVSTSVRSILAGFGLTIVDDPAVLGLYQDPYIKNTALEPAQVIGKAVTFSDIVPETNGGSASLNAADMLALRSMEWLLAHDRSYWEWRVNSVEIASVKVLEAGQYVDMLRYLDVQTVKPTPMTETLTDLVTREVTMTWDAQRQMPLFDLVLSDVAADPGDGGRAVAQALRNYDRMVRRVAVGRDDRGTTRFIGTAGTTGTGVHSHGEYLLRSGGHMSGNITLDATRTVDGVDVSVHAADPNAHHATATAGNSAISITGQAISGAANSTGGLEVSSGMRVKLPTDSGINRDSTGLYLAPAQVTATSTNSVSGVNHTHAVTATDNANTTVSTLLKGSATGYLTVAGLGVGDTATTSAAIYAKSKATDDYTLYLRQLTGQSASMIRVEDYLGSALILLTGGGDLESGQPGFVSGQTGWQITARGNAEFNNARIRGELHASTFVADEISAVGGTLMVVTTTRVAAPVGANDNKLPAVNSSFTLNVQASWDTAANYLPVGSIIRMKPMGEIASGGSLDLYDIYVQVTAVSASPIGRNLDTSIGAVSPGYYALTCTRRLGGETNFIIPTGTAAVKWTTIDSVGTPATYTGAVQVVGEGSAGPYVDVFTVNKPASATWGGVEPTIKPRVRLGNLVGVLGKSADEWGMAAAVDLSNTNVVTQQYIVASSAGLDMRNINLKIYGAANPTVEITSSGDLKLGTDIGSDATTTLRFYPASGALRLGPLVSGKPNLYWDGTDLHLRQHTTPVITLESSGASYFSGVMTIGTSGEIRQGTGTLGSNFTGLRIFRSSNVGILRTYNNDTTQIELNTSGQLTAGAGSVLLSANGIEIRPYTTTGTGYVDMSATTSALRLRTSGGNIAGYISGRYDSSNAYNAIWMAADNTHYVLASEDIIELISSDVVIGRSGAAGDIFIYGDIIHSGGNADFNFSAATLEVTQLEASVDVIADHAVVSHEYIKADTGVAAGVDFPTIVGEGQFASDLGGFDYRAVVLTDSTDINHGMTALAASYQYGGLGKSDAASGGLAVDGFSEIGTGVAINGHGTSESTSTSTASTGAVIINGILQSGTGGTALGSTGNILSVRNNGTTRFLVKGNGDFHYDGSGSAYDNYDDVALLGALNREAWGGALDGAWRDFLAYNRDNLITAGIVSSDGFINGAALNRLLVGAIMQLNARLARLE